MKINNNLFMLNLFKGYRIKENKTEQKPKSEIQIMLEQRAKDIEDTNIHYKKDGIARRIARGDEISPEDRAFLAKHDPDLLRKADMAARKGKELERRLKNAKTEREARAITTEASIEIQQAFKNNDEVYADLLSEAYREVSLNRKQKKADSPEENKLDIEI